MATPNTIHADLVEQFIAVTGVERDVAISFLEACAGDLDMAVGMHMDSGGADVPSSGRQGGCSTVNDDGEGDVRAPIPQKTEVLVEDDSSILGGSWRVRRHRLHRSVFDGFRNFQSEPHQYDGSLRGRKSSKKRSLEELYRPPVEIIFKGTFQNARDMGSAQNKWLLVNVQNVQEFSCQLLNRDVWSNIDARTIIAENFVFWQVYNDSEEGKRFMQFYKLTKWPYVAVIDPFTGESQVVWNKISDGKVLCELVKEFLSACPVPDQSLLPPSAKRQKREPSILDASEQEQMEAAVQASLVESKTKMNVPQYVLDSDSEADAGGNSDGVETFSDTDDVIFSALSASSNGVSPSALVPTASTAPLPRGPNTYLKSYFGQQHSQPPLSVAVSATSNNSSLETENSMHLFSSSVSNESLGIGLGDTWSSLSPSSLSSASLPWPGLSDPLSLPLPSLRWRGLSPWSMSSSSQPERSSPLEINIESSLTDMIGCREAEVGTPDTCTLDDASQLSTPDRDLMRESHGGSQGSSIQTSQGSSQSQLLSQGSLSQPTQSSNQAGSSWTNYWGHPSDPVSKIIIRFPNNKREHVELPCTSQLKALAVYCSDQGFPTDRFELVTNYPRRKLSEMASSMSLKEAGLHLQETVFVQDL